MRMGCKLSYNINIRSLLTLDFHLRIQREAISIRLSDFLHFVAAFLYNLFRLKNTFVSKMSFLSKIRFE